jgi:hypothetical protein
MVNFLAIFFAFKFLVNLRCKQPSPLSTYLIRFTGFTETFAEMSVETKNGISHRRRALNALKEYFAAGEGLARLRADLRTDAGGRPAH